MKLGVTYPWASPFMYSAAAENMVNLQRPDGVDTRFFRGMGWAPARRHIDGCMKALEWGADYICVIGSDQVHAEDMLPRLWARLAEGYEVISALVPCRGYVAWQKMKPFQPMAWRFRPSSQTDKIRKFRGVNLDRDMVEIVDPADGEMQRVNFIGSGVIMFHREHLLSLREPWFFERVHNQTQTRLASMDTTFCWRLQTEAFAKVWVDTTIDVKHLHIFEIDGTYSERFADWASGDGDPAVCSYETPQAFDIPQSTDAAA